MSGPALCQQTVDDYPAIRRVSCSELFAAPRSAAMFAEYAAECALPELGSPRPQPDLYQKLEDAGSLRCFVVSEGENIVGFATLLVYTLPHYGKKVAATESIFVPKAYRTSWIGLRLLAFIEDHARTEGCAAVLYSAPTGSQFAALLALKYRHSNEIFVRSLT